MPPIIASSLPRVDPEGVRPDTPTSNIDPPSNRPRESAGTSSQSRFDAVPLDLRTRRQWVVWRKLNRRGKVTKVPFRADIPEAEASTTDPSTWSSFECALAAFLDPDNRLDGIGFVFSDVDDLSGVDFDNCLDEHGNVMDWARDWLDSLEGYFEISPSGRGIKVFTKGSVPEGKGRKLQRLGPDGKGAIEAYDRGRYFTVTGEVFEGHTELGDGSDALARSHSEWFRPKAGNPRPSHAWKAAPPVAGDAELIAKAGRAGNGPKFSSLFSGSIEGHPSKSEADLALCSHLAFWTGGDVQAIDRLFRQSGLFDDKWDQRADYRDMTIAKACERQAYYDPGYRSEGSRPAGVSRSQLRVVRSPEHSVDPPEPGDVPEPPRPGGIAVEPDPEKINLTDSGNAVRMVKHFGHLIRYCGQYGKWLIWDRMRWKEDATGEIFRIAQKTIRKMVSEAASIDDPAEMKALLKWAIESESKKRIDAMIYLARFVEGVPIEPSQLDRDGYLFNVRNGTIDLRTGLIGPHRREDLITKLADEEFDPQADCPRWRQFELEIMDGDEAMVGYLRRIAGYAITGDVREHMLFFFHGMGRNGKSLWLNTLLKLLGDYATSINATMITAKQNDDHPTGLTDLEGRRFVSTIEVADGKKMAEALVKQLTGGDPIKARRMRQDFYQFNPTHKLILAANHKPEIRGKDEAIWERVKLVPFPVTFVDEGRVDPSKKMLLKDKDLSRALESEASGILALLVRSCLEWQASGMQEPSTVVDATAEYRAEMDDLADFIEQRCQVLDGVRVKATTLYEAYATWAKSRGENPIKERAFGSEMEQRGYNLKKSNSVAWRFGIALCDERPTDNPY